MKATMHEDGIVGQYLLLPCGRQGRGHLDLSDEAAGDPHGIDSMAKFAANTLEQQAASLSGT